MLPQLTMIAVDNMCDSNRLLEKRIKDLEEALRNVLIWCTSAGYSPMGMTHEEVEKKFGRYWQLLKEK